MLLKDCHKHHPLNPPEDLVRIPARGRACVSEDLLSAPRHYCVQGVRGEAGQGAALPGQHLLHLQPECS